ncbi:MAG: hypothetical protein QXZ43_03420 [Candidatus Aenigmatarchaeota archaeon]
MKGYMLLLVSLIKSALAKPTGEIIEIPVVKSRDDLLRNYSMFVGTVLSLIVILFIILMIKIYRKRKKTKKLIKKKK